MSVDFSQEEYMALASGLDTGQLDCLVRLLRLLAADLPEDGQVVEVERRWWVMAGEPVSVGALVG